MSSERQLADVAINQQLWAEATNELFREDWETRDQADYYGQGLVDAVAAGQLAVADLRQLRLDANRLDHETVEVSGGDIESLGDADYFEAIARRIANQATGYALERVKTRRLRFLQHRQVIRQGSQSQYALY